VPVSFPILPGVIHRPFSGWAAGCDILKMVRSGDPELR